MAETAITIVGNDLNAATETRALQIVKAAGVEGVDIDRLKPGYAVDILLKASNPTLTATLRQKLEGFGRFDIFIQPQDMYRKKKLLVADMDATIVRQETLDELADHLNLKDKIAPITAKAMAGDIDFHEALRMRVKLLRGLPLSAIYETLAKVEYSAGAATLVKTMNRFGAKCALVSGGFEQFTGHVAATLGFHKNIGNRLGIENDHLTGDVIPPIVDKFFKEQAVVDQAKVVGCDVKHVLSIGDGANDIPMLQKAGVGIGYFGKPAVVAATPHQIRYTDLVTVLYMQGYRQSEIGA